MCLIAKRPEQLIRSIDERFGVVPLLLQQLMARARAARSNRAARSLSGVSLAISAFTKSYLAASNPRAITEMSRRICSIRRSFEARSRHDPGQLLNRELHARKLSLQRSGFRRQCTRSVRPASRTFAGMSESCSNLLL